MAFWTRRAKVDALILPSPVAVACSWPQDRLGQVAVLNRSHPASKFLDISFISSDQDPIKTNEDRTICLFHITRQPCGMYGIYKTTMDLRSLGSQGRFLVLVGPIWLREQFLLTNIWCLHKPDDCIPCCSPLTRLWHALWRHIEMLSNRLKRQSFRLCCSGANGANSEGHGNTTYTAQPCLQASL